MSDGRGAGNGRDLLPEPLADLFGRYLRGELSVEEYTALALRTLHPPEDDAEQG